MGFLCRLRYAINHWPIERPLRWIFNKPLRDNPRLEPSIKDVVITTVRNLEGRYWFSDGVVESATAAAESEKDKGQDAIIDAIEREIKKHALSLKEGFEKGRLHELRGWPNGHG